MMVLYEQYLVLRLTIPSYMDHFNVKTSFKIDEFGLKNEMNKTNRKSQTLTLYDNSSI